MDKKIELVVTGIPETVHALESLGKFDIEKAEQNAADALIPAVKAGTRTESGALAGGWIAEGGGFVNHVDYVLYQEFGTVYVEPTFAIGKAMEQEQQLVTKAFEDEIQHAADKARFDS